MTFPLVDVFFLVDVITMSEQLSLWDVSVVSGLKLKFQKKDKINPFNLFLHQEFNTQCNICTLSKADLESLELVVAHIGSKNSLKQRDFLEMYLSNCLSHTYTRHFI